MRNKRWFVAALVMVTVLWPSFVSAAPAPVQRNNLTTNVNGQPIIGNVIVSNTVANGGWTLFTTDGVHFYNQFGVEYFHIYGSSSSSVAADFASQFGTFYTNGTALFFCKNPSDVALTLAAASGAYVDLLSLLDGSGAVILRAKTNGMIYSAAMSGNRQAFTDINTNLVSASVSNLTWASTVDLSFNSAPYNYLIVTNNTTFTSSQLGAGKTITVKMFAGTTNYTLTFPTWTFLGAGAPSQIASNKTGVLSITAWDGNTTNVIAAWAVQP
jgi:hypothetical protein